MIDYDDKPDHVSWGDWGSMSQSEKQYELDVDGYISDGKWPEDKDDSDDD
ncbi:MAG: hypothetical protein R8K22_08050 [Mariprofundaceae bacterium]